MTDVVVQDKDIVVEVEQPTVPEAAKPPAIGLVEINQVVQRGSAWMTGHGTPTLPGGQYGDMYLDVDTGDMYLWTGNAWEYQGTFAPATLTPEEILEMLITVDGAGSNLDADLLDGQHGVYYAKQSDMTTQTTRNDAQDTQLANHELRIGGNETSITDLYDRVDAADAGQTPNAILTKIKTVDGPGSGLDADTLDGHDTGYFLAATDYNAADVLTKLKTVDGAGSGLDADLLDGQTGSYYLDLGNSTGTINDTKHGNLGGGTLHAPATAAAFGFFKDAASDDKQYVRKNGAWMEVSVPPGTYVGDDPPANPADNQMWMKASTGALYIWFFDGDSRQWIQVSAMPQMAPMPTSPWELIGNFQLTAATEKVVPNLGGYRRLRFGGAINNSVAAYLQMRFSLDNGATWKAGATDYSYQRLLVGGATSTPSSATSTAFLISASNDAGANFRLCFKGEIEDFNQPVLASGFGEAGYFASNQIAWTKYYNRTAFVGPCNALQLLMSGGTMTGWFSLEGWRG